MLNLTLEMVRSLEVREIKTTPYIKEEVGDAYLLKYYHKTYFYVNLTEIQSAMNTINTNYYILTAKIRDPLIDQMTILYTQIRNTYALLTNKRTKRGLINGLGSIVKFI